MKKNKTKGIIVFIIFVLLFVDAAFSEEKNQKKGGKRPLNHLFVIDGKDKVLTALNNPEKMINEPLLKMLDKKLGIDINRNSMLKTYQCINDLLNTTSHMSKVSTGNIIVKIKVELNSNSKKTSMFASKKKQTLEYPELEITFYYNNKNIEPTVLNCSGQRYY